MFVAVVIGVHRRFGLQIKRLVVAYGTKLTTAGAAAAASGKIMAISVTRSFVILH
jgi:hypothetical protein